MTTAGKCRPAIEIVAPLFLLAGAAFGQASSVSLTTTPNPAAYGSPVTLTATVTGGGTGTVTFFDGAEVIGIQTISGTTAVLAYSLLGTGKHSLRAIYGGDADHFQSTLSAVVAQTVNASAPLALRYEGKAAVNPTFFALHSTTGDIDGDGKTDLVYSFDLGFNALASTEADITHALGKISHDSALIPNYTQVITAPVLGDFNGDGKADLAYESFHYGLLSGEGRWANLSVMTGTGDGFFQNPTHAGGLGEDKYTDPFPVLIAGDFNVDGKVDIFAQPYMFLGNGDGTFQPRAKLANVDFLKANNGVHAEVSIAGDFNGDGIPDLAFINGSGSSGGKVTVQLGTGSGTFQDPVDYPVGAANSTDSVLAGDFNGDGFADLAVGQYAGGAGLISILFGSGNGTFQPAITSTIAPGRAQAASNVLAADFDGDGIQDLAAIGAFGFNLLLGKGDGTFQTAMNYDATYPLLKLIRADFDGDGRVDLGAYLTTTINGEQRGWMDVYLGNATVSPSLLASLSHTGSFRQGTSGSFAINLSNGANAPATNIRVLISPTAGLTVTGISGSNWTCTLSSRNCVRPPAAGIGNGSAPINVTVGVNMAAPSPQSISATLYSDGTSPVVFSDSVPIVVQPYYSFTLTHSGNFTQGQTGYYILTAGNAPSSPGPVNDTVSVVLTVPSGLTLVSMAGSGWNCPIGNTCTRSDALAPGSAYPPITATVKVAANAGASVNMIAALGDSGPYGWGAFDPTTILKGQAISFTPLSNSFAGAAPFAVTATSTSGLTPGFASSTTPVCTVSGSTVTLVAAGGCTITATQAGDATYGPAVPVKQSFTVAFGDVGGGDFDAAAISLLAQHGITAGCGGDGFCPDSNVTRAQMAIFMVRSIEGGDTFSYAASPYFGDVQPADFGFKWIQKMKELGITVGCGNGNYCPNDSITRAQMAIFLIRARLGVNLAGPVPTFSYPSAPYFTDVAAGDFAFAWIQRMKLDSITSGCTATAFCPNDFVTRGQMAIFIMRGAFNQLLPAGTPVLAQISPATLSPGSAATFTVTGVNTNFVQGATVLSPLPGITAAALTVTSPTTFTVQLSAAADAVLQPYSVLAITGSEEAVLPNGLTVQ